MTDENEDVKVETVLEEQHVCPECGESFDTKAGLGKHRSAKHGVAGQNRRLRSGDSAPRRRSSGGRRDKREQQIKETIDEFVKLSNEMRGRSNDQIEDLADLLRRDANKIAYSLSWVAERIAPVGWFVDKTMGHGGVLTIATGFSGLFRKAVRGWRDLLAKRREDDVIYDEFGNPMTLLDGDPSEAGDPAGS